MRRGWKYQTALLHPAAISFLKTKGWRLKEIDEQEQHNWKQTEIYPTVVAFCNQMGQQGWELTSVASPNPTTSDEVVLHFKRLLQ